MNTKAPPRGSGVAGELFHPDDNHYLNILTFNYKIHMVSIHAFMHSCIFITTGIHFIGMIIII